MVVNEVQKRRKYKGITQKQLASNLGISLALVIKIEKHNYTPKYLIRKKLSDYFDVKMNQLFYKGDNSNVI